jgi:hypothetical protein
MGRFSLFALIIVCAALLETQAQIPANLTASHVGEYATVEGVVAEIFTSKAGNTFFNIGAAHPNQTFTGYFSLVAINDI